MPDVHLMTLDPGHFHAALVQREMYPGVGPRVDVFAPLGDDLYQHLRRIDGFNRRADRPTAWVEEVHASADFFERMLRERPGNVAVLSGRNRGKADRIVAAVKNGLHVLADKPWILESADLPKVDEALAEADRRGIVAYDLMTERFEITSILQRVLVNDRPAFGEIVKGTKAEPAVHMESVHHLMKIVAGAPNTRPPWYFDIMEQGEGFNDIGTHLVDLVQWTAFPDQAIDYHGGVRVLSADRWPTWISEASFRRVTNEPRFPESLAPSVKNRELEVLLQHARVLYPARHSHQAERHLGLGSAAGFGGHAFCRLSGHARATRSPADRARSIPARALRHSERFREHSEDPECRADEVTNTTDGIPGSERRAARQ